MTELEADRSVKGSLELSILTKTAKDLSKVKGQNKYLAAELAITKQYMAYLSGQNKYLRDQLHQDNYVNSKLYELLKTPPQPVTSVGAIVHEEQEKLARMDDLRDSGRVINSELALPPSLTSNAVEQISSTSIAPL